MMTQNRFATLRVIFATTLTLVSAFTRAEGLVESLKRDELQSAPSGVILPATRQDKILRGLSRGVPPSTEGIPGQEEELNPQDLLNSEYPTSVLIKRAIEDASRQPIGRRISFYEQRANMIIQSSGQKPTEEASRLVLNRSVDTVQTIIQWAGNNSELVAQYIAQFYKMNFELALGYVNNPPNTTDLEFPRGKVGITIANGLWQNQSGLISDSSKAIIMVKLLGYLGQDLNSDVRRRNTDFRLALLDIYDIQKNDYNYQSILKALENKEEPRSADIARLRSRINQIMQSLWALKL